MLKRLLKLEDIQEDSIFLWGARQTGKSTLLQTLFPKAVYFDLLKADVFTELKLHPSILRQRVLALPSTTVVILDEVQKIPDLLDEVHWLMVNHGTHFILCGSSARKLRRSGANLLGGRALSERLYPFVSAEIPDFDLHHALNYGMLPRHYLSKNPKRRLKAYVGDYLQQEIIAEALARDLTSFTRFMSIAAVCNGEIVNYTNVASDCGVSAVTVKGYFSILEETMVGFYVPAFNKTTKRRVTQMPKFYFFDVGIVNSLLNRAPLEQGTTEYGQAFEHLIMQEIVAYLGYSRSDKKLTYWRTYDNNYEVDAVIGDAEVAMEIKSTTQVRNSHFRGLRVFSQEHPGAKLIVVSNEDVARIVDNITVLPVNDFLKLLWGGKILNP